MHHPASPRLRLHRSPFARFCRAGALGLATLVALPSSIALAQGAAPPGHARMSNPHGNSDPKEPIINLASDLPPGVLEVRVIDRRFMELGGRTINLHVTRQSIEQGTTESLVTAQTDERGVARFEGLGTDSDHHYRVSLSEGPANYRTAAFSFSPKGGGIRAFIPIFPVTQNLQEAVILSRALLLVVPRDDVFTFEVMWRIENYGKHTWVPNNVVFDMPDGFKAFQAEEMRGDGRFVPVGDDQLRLEGTFPPGRHDVLFRFQLPNKGDPELAFDFPTTLHMGFLRVMVDASPTMTLSVDGFETPEETRNREGQRRLTTARDYLGEKTRAPDHVRVHIGGIPTPSRGRNVAASLAGLIALAGLGQALGRRRRPQNRAPLSPEDLRRAEELLLNELVEVEKAFARGAIGRKMRERTRQQLLEAFARLSVGEGAAEAEGSGVPASKERAAKASTAAG